MSTGRNLITGRVSFLNRDGYRLFKKTYPSSPITYDEYITILKESTLCIKQHILENPIGFKLPCNLGYIAVHKYKPKKTRIMIDWVNTKKHGKRIPLLNLHSMGYMYKILFYKNTKSVFLSSIDIKPHRHIKRELASKLKNGVTPYIELQESFFTKRFSINNSIKK